MEDTHSVATLMDSTTSKIQQLQKAFAELESHRAVTLNMKWQQLEEHFNGLQKSLKRRFTELEDQEKGYNSKIMKAQEMLEKREKAVITKEQATLQRLQEKRDAAVSAIVNALQRPKKGSSSESSVLDSADQIETSCVEDGLPGDSDAESKPADMANLCEIENFDASYPELWKLCREMDSKGLHKFISDNRKNLAAIREEIPLSLKAAADPASLILDSLEGFYNSEGSSLEGKKDSNLLGLRRTCIMLMECLSVLLMNLDPCSVNKIISENAKCRANAIADEWKPKLDELEVDASNGNSLEAHAFLQLLATFGIDSGFDQEAISKLIPMVSRRHQAADLCRSLGLSEKMPGVINVLVNSGRQIDAVNLAFAFDLTEQFSPASLLESYLADAKKVDSPVRSGNTSTAQIDISEKELTALKAVIKCIEDNKLENHYPVEPLQKQVVELEKAKAEKKKATEVAKPQSKRARANTISHMPRLPNAVSENSFYARPTDRYSPYVYDRSAYAYASPNFYGNGYPYQTAYLH